MSAISITEIGIDELDPVMAIMAAAFDPGYGEAWTESQTLSMLVLPGVWLSLARIDGRPAGFALNRQIADEAELLLLAVAPDCRRQGVALALIDRTLALLRNRNGHRLHLEVRHNNPAIELYKRAGFTLIGRRPGYYHGIDGQIHDALTLSSVVQPA
ncbi:GNAT family N-acetyltransferase [Rhizorhabdus dicambivorans]|uniref:GNAT family N-acetyltransferase n=1 Tax=Rhizorhabdus dicambivorans TaxID=1850238 RepID=A0A2A4FTN5_9SPHN|nr:GNAT family N-acetyltransferase [Rhizorhabdus dicambivorans]ATE66997.1 GNAT family N-acetyltransferase [Rhizorhabdus dicambivorans]PCE42127.1 GNAT family N-acetyltransferase [Rhizorhabdus dicambivorans]